MFTLRKAREIFLDTPHTWGRETLGVRCCTRCSLAAGYKHLQCTLQYSQITACLRVAKLQSTNYSVLIVGKLPDPFTHGPFKETL